MVAFLEVASRIYVVGVVQMGIPVPTISHVLYVWFERPDQLLDGRRLRATGDAPVQVRALLAADGM